jgi:hypothetical protein
MFDDVVMLEKDIVNVWMDEPEIALEIGNESRDCDLGNRERATHNIPNPVFLSRPK